MFTLPDFYKAKREKRPISVLTAYDAPSASICEAAGVDSILVGDSVAMVVHGYSDTLSADLDMMSMHIAAVRRGAPHTFIIGDMPFVSTRTGLHDATRSAARLMRAGANAVKLEGREGHEEIISHLVASGIPVMGHLGLQPQSVNIAGGYRVQGKADAEAQKILADAQILQDSGCFSMVAECVPPDLGAELSASLELAVIGIGAGNATDGQVLVWHDLLGNTVLDAQLNLKKAPRFVRRYLQTSTIQLEAVKAWLADMGTRNFPSKEESYPPRNATSSLEARATERGTGDEAGYGGAS